MQSIRPIRTEDTIVDEPPRTVARSLLDLIASIAVVAAVVLVAGLLGNTAHAETQGPALSTRTAPTLD